MTLPLLSLLSPKVQELCSEEASGQHAKENQYQKLGPAFQACLMELYCVTMLQLPA